MDPREQYESLMEGKILSQEETFEGISQYLNLDNEIKKQDSQYEKVNPQILINSLWHHFNYLSYAANSCYQNTNLEKDMNYKKEICRCLNTYIRILEEGSGEIWVNAVQKAPEMITVLSERDDSLDYYDYVGEIFRQLTKIPKDSDICRSFYRKIDVLFVDLANPIKGSSPVESIFNKTTFSKYPEIVTKNIIQFCRSIEQLSSDYKLDEYFFYRNLAPKLSFLGEVSWEKQTLVKESVSNSIDFIDSFSKKIAERKGFKSFAGGSKYMAEVFTEIFNNSLTENIEKYPEIFLKFPNLIMEDMLRVLKDNGKEKEGDAQIYSQSLGEIVNCILKKDADLFITEIQKYIDVIIKTYYEGTSYQRYIAHGQLIDSLLFNSILGSKDKPELKKIYAQGKNLIEKGDFSTFYKLVNSYREEKNIYKILSLYRSLFYWAHYKAQISDSFNESVKKTFYEISTL
jgi:hypothetical protein